MKRSPLRRIGRNPTAVLKEKIQAKLREIVIKRDGGCVLREYPETGKCSDVLQAEHLISRSNTLSFADTRNIVCLCSKHHIFWKPQHSKLYWELIEGIIGVKRWEWIKEVEKEVFAHRSHKVDLKLALIYLEQELKQLK